MAATKWLCGIFIAIALTELVTCKKIMILSDFTKLEDKEFFKTTFPWIVQNVGPGLHVNYYLNDGKKGGKRMCVLDNLKRNIHLQADYLKCEAGDGKECTKKLPLDQRRLNKCQRKINKKIRAAEKQFRRYEPDETPIIVRGRSQQTVHDPMAVLLNICGMFGRRQPPGCRTPSELPQPVQQPTSASSEAPVSSTETQQTETTTTSNQATSASSEAPVSSTETQQTETTTTSNQATSASSEAPVSSTETQQTETTTTSNQVSSASYENSTSNTKSNEKDSTTELTANDADTSATAAAQENNNY